MYFRIPIKREMERLGSDLVFTLRGKGNAMEAVRDALSAWRSVWCHLQVGFTPVAVVPHKMPFKISSYTQTSQSYTYHGNFICYSDKNGELLLNEKHNRHSQVKNLYQFTRIG